MSEITEQAQNPETDSDELKMPDELTILKQRAKMMGITHSPNIGVDTLRAKIREHMEALEAKNKEEGRSAEPTSKPKGPNVEVSETKTKTKSLRQYLIEENMKLVRLRITNLDPKKKDLPGEIFTVSNNVLGVVKKYIPYGEATEDGYHVPYCIYKALKARRFLNVRVRKSKNRHEPPTIHTDYVPEFALEVLPPLTPEELKKLAAAQLAAGNS